MGQWAASGQALLRMVWRVCKRAGIRHLSPHQSGRDFVAPDTPPGNIISGPLAAVLDMGRDLARNTMRRAKRAMT